MNWAQFQFVQRWMGVLKGERGSQEGTRGLEQSQGSAEWPRVGQCECDQAASRVCSLAVMEVRLLCSQRLGDRGPVLPVVSFQRNVFPDPGKRHSWFAGDTATSQKDRRRIHNCKPFLSKHSEKGQPLSYPPCWLEQTVNPLGCLSFLRQAL